MRPLSLHYDVMDILETASRDKSPFVRRYVADFLISKLPNVEAYIEYYQLLKDDQHPFLKERMEFITKKMEQKNE